MTVKPLRNVKAMWSKKLSKMWGVPVRPRITQSLNSANKFREKIPFGKTPLGETISKQKPGKTKTVIFINPKTKQPEAVVAHELGHAAHEAKLGVQRISPLEAATVKGFEKLQLTEFFARVSEFEYCKRFDRKRYSETIKENLKRGAPGVTDGQMLAVRFLTSFPNAKDRNRLIRELLSQNFQHISQVYNFLKNKGLKVDKPRFHIKKKK